MIGLATAVAHDSKVMTWNSVNMEPPMSPAAQTEMKQRRDAPLSYIIPFIKTEDLIFSIFSHLYERSRKVVTNAESMS